MRSMEEVQPGEFMWCLCKKRRKLVKFNGVWRVMFGLAFYYEVEFPSGLKHKHQVPWTEPLATPDCGLIPMGPLEQLAAAEQFDSTRSKIIWTAVFTLVTLVLIGIATVLSL